MAEFKAHKVVSALPDPLEADTIYFVRTGAGFDLFVSDTTGNVAYSVNGPIDWIYLKEKWDAPPTLNATISSGDVYNYTLGGVTRYRLVPEPYVAANDAFYTGFDGTTLSGLIAARGE